MLIKSSFVDYYDHLADGTKKSPVYTRKTSIEYDCEKKYKIALLRARIGYGKARNSDLFLSPNVTNMSAKDSISAIPYIFGIGGKLYTAVHYTNSILGISEFFLDYKSLTKYYKNDALKRNFDMIESGLCSQYSYNQFGCVNFSLHMDGNSIILIKEPILDDLPAFISAESAYADIDTFLKEKKIRNAEYKAIIPTQYEQNYV